MKRVAILQSNYFPWKGYFDIIAAVDEFILLDDVQFTKNDWRNRNLIKTAQGTKSITNLISVRSLRQKINEVTVADRQWPIHHWRKLSDSYHGAPYFSHYKETLEMLFLETTNTSEWDKINRRALGVVWRYIGVETKITFDTDYAPPKVEALSVWSTFAGRWVLPIIFLGQPRKPIFRRSSLPRRASI